MVPNRTNSKDIIWIIWINSPIRIAPTPIPINSKKRNLTLVKSKHPRPFSIHIFIITRRNHPILSFNTFRLVFCPSLNSPRPNNCFNSNFIICIHIKVCCISSGLDTIPKPVHVIASSKQASLIIFPDRWISRLSK